MEDSLHKPIDMQPSEQRPKRSHRPSPLSVCISATDIEKSVDDDEADEADDEAEEDPLADLECAVNQDIPQNPSLIADGTPPSDCSPEVLPEDKLPTHTITIRSIITVARSVPKYWDASHPLKGETREQFEAAARRARYRALKSKHLIRELARRNLTLRDTVDGPTQGLGTLPVAVETGRIEPPEPCTQRRCQIYDKGWFPEVKLAVSAADILRERLQILDEYIDEELDEIEKRSLVEERETLHEEERRRTNQALQLFHRASK